MNNTGRKKHDDQKKKRGVKVVLYVSYFAGVVLGYLVYLMQS